jgi:hypothetical protein
MFGNKQGKTVVCDTACRAQQVRESALYKSALQGPRF